MLSARFCEREALHCARFLHGLSKRKILPKHIATGKLDSCIWMERSRIAKKLDLDAFYQVGFKMISLLFKSNLTGVSSDGVWPGPSRDTLICLHCIDWILKQNLRIQSQSPEQKLCYKARWFLWHGNVKAFHISWNPLGQDLLEHHWIEL